MEVVLALLKPLSNPLLQVIKLLAAATALEGQHSPRLQIGGRHAAWVASCCQNQTGWQNSLSDEPVDQLFSSYAWDADGSDGSLQKHF